MFGVAALALGLVLIVEGLVYALAPQIVERMLEALRSIPPEARRTIGMLALISGLILVWLGKSLGA
ncbi:DUF2065 domain-containing protein [Pseudohalocynthiibacter aestuariivivens]|nr:DUF2065 domain-containing protein [Pseudohalocynthiibacter aestuariivivens]QIE44941.1 DUF2065 domain-containing protein [Pseudohalocynthiibacter aestuariivivens]